MAKMFLMTGLSGVGKTTYALSFSKSKNYLYLGIDDFYRAFNNGTHDNEFEVWMAFFNAIHCAEQQRKDCVIDTNSPTIVDRTQFLNWFPSFQHHLIYIYGTDELRIANNKHRDRIIPDDEMERMKKVYQIPYIYEDNRWKSLLILNNINNKFYVV